MPEISVIVPVYNVEKYIAQCLDSILEQDFRDFEVICVNDGSTDASGEILATYAERDGRVKILAQDNQGLSAARNSGQRVAAGKYVCYIDSDDMITPGYFQTLYQEAERSGAEIISFEMAPLLYEEEGLVDRKKDEYFRIKEEYSGLKAGSIYFCEMIENDDFIDSACLLFIRRSWMEDQGVFFEEGKLYEDADFSIKCYFQCQRMVHISNELYIYRVRNMSIMTQPFHIGQAESRMWMVTVLLKEMYRSERSEREIGALSKYAIQMIYSFKFISDHLGFEDLRRLEDKKGIEGFLVNASGVDVAKSVYNRELYLRGLLDVFKEGRKVILYGAGIVGDKVIKLLQKYHHTDNVLGFAVTASASMKEKEGFSVKPLREYAAEEETIVVITASGKSHLPMIRYAQEAGFQRIYLVDYKLESIIDTLLAGKERGFYSQISDYWAVK